MEKKKFYKLTNINWQKEKINCTVLVYNSAARFDNKNPTG